MGITYHWNCDFHDSLPSFSCFPVIGDSALIESIISEKTLEPTQLIKYVENNQYTALVDFLRTQQFLQKTDSSLSSKNLKIAEIAAFYHGRIFSRLISDLLNIEGFKIDDPSFLELLTEHISKFDLKLANACLKDKHDKYRDETAQPFLEILIFGKRIDMNRDDFLAVKKMIEGKKYGSRYCNFVTASHFPVIDDPSVMSFYIVEHDKKAVCTLMDYITSSEEASLRIDNISKALKERLKNFTYDHITKILFKHLLETKNYPVLLKLLQADSDFFSSRTWLDDSIIWLLGSSRERKAIAVEFSKKGKEKLLEPAKEGKDTVEFLEILDMAILGSKNLDYPIGWLLYNNPSSPHVNRLFEAVPMSQAMRVLSLFIDKSGVSEGQIIKPHLNRLFKAVPKYLDAKGKKDPGYYDFFQSLKVIIQKCIDGERWDVVKKIFSLDIGRSSNLYCFHTAIKMLIDEIGVKDTIKIFSSVKPELKGSVMSAYLKDSCDPANPNAIAFLEQTIDTTSLSLDNLLKIVFKTPKSWGFKKNTPIIHLLYKRMKGDDIYDHIEKHFLSQADLSIDAIMPFWQHLHKADFNDDNIYYNMAIRLSDLSKADPRAKVLLDDWLEKSSHRVNFKSLYQFIEVDFQGKTLTKIPKKHGTAYHDGQEHDHIVEEAVFGLHHIDLLAKIFKYRFNAEAFIPFALRFNETYCAKYIERGVGKDVTREYIEPKPFQVNKMKFHDSMMPDEKRESSNAVKLGDPTVTMSYLKKILVATKDIEGIDKIFEKDIFPVLCENPAIYGGILECVTYKNLLKEAIKEGF